jgi:hypothetical protein
MKVASCLRQNRYVLRLLLNCVIACAGAVAIGLTAAAVSEMLSQPFVVKTSFVAAEQHSPFACRICGNVMVGVGEELASFDRSGYAWLTGESVIHTVTVRETINGKDQTNLVATENVLLTSPVQLLNPNYTAPATHPPGTVRKRVTYASRFSQLRLDIPNVEAEWTREPTLPGIPRRCFELDARILPTSGSDGEGRKETWVSLVETPVSCNVTFWEQNCPGRVAPDCWPLDCWDRWTFNLVDAFVEIAPNGNFSRDTVQIALSLNKVVKIELEEEVFQEARDGVDQRRRFLPSTSSFNYGFGRYNLYHSLFAPQFYTDNSTAGREAYFDSLNQPIPGSNFFAVAISWKSNIVSVFVEQSNIDNRFLIGSLVGIFATMISIINSFFVFWLAEGQKKEENQKEQPEDDILENQFALGIPLRKS